MSCVASPFLDFMSPWSGPHVGRGKGGEGAASLGSLTAPNQVCFPATGATGNMFARVASLWMLNTQTFLIFRPIVKEFRPCPLYLSVLAACCGKVFH